MQASVESGGLRIELARREDDSGLRAILRATPMGGAIEVAFHTEPSFFRAVGIQGTEVQVGVGTKDGAIVGLGTRALRPTWVNGKIEVAGYLGDLRLLHGERGGTAVARGYRFLRELHADGRARIYSTVIVADNTLALETLASGRAGLPRYRNLGRILTPMLRTRRYPVDPGISGGAREALPEIVAKLNEPKLQLAPAWTEDDFLSGRLAAFRIEDFQVLRRDGRVAGVMGFWDQRSFRQTIVNRYHGPLGLFRPLVNLFRSPPLPEPGDTLAFGYAAFVAADTPDDYGRLLRRVLDRAADAGLDYLSVSLHENDPRVPVLDLYSRVPFAGRLYVVTFDGDPGLDARVPWVEGALL